MAEAARPLFTLNKNAHPKTYSANFPASGFSGRLSNERRRG